jgi:putative membrane protein
VGLVGALFLVPGARVDAGLDVSRLPAVNAALNATSALCLAAGWVCIRRRAVAAHRACMLAAFGVSTLFLLSYVAYHVQAEPVRFAGQGGARVVYFALLVSHIVLAAAVVPLALVTIQRAWTGAFARHRAIARVALPVWLYVSASGVLVYWLLYHVYAPR